MSKKTFWTRTIFFFAAGFLLYAGTLHSAFHLDDFPFIIKNPTIRNITDLGLIGQSVLTVHARHTVFFSLALNYHLNKLDVFGYHIFNTLVHILTVIGIWQFTRLLLSTPRFASDVTPENRENIAFCAALLFLCHPVHTQAITYITQRFASMATMFYIGTLGFYLRARLAAHAGAAAPFFILAAASAVLGMFSKEIAITLPFMALAIDRLCISNGQPKRMPRALILGLAGTALIIPILFRHHILGIFSMQIPSSSHDGDLLTFNTFLLTQFRVMALLLRLLVLPVNQNLDYDFPMSTGLFAPVTTFLSLGLLVLLAFVAWKTFKKNFIISFAILWFFITYLPEFYPRTHVIFEHKLYLASIGFFIAFAWMLWSRPELKKTARWIMIILCAILSLVTTRRNMVWQTEQTLWEDVVRKSPHKYRGNLNLGNVYQLQGKYDQSLPYYDKAIAAMPYGYKALNSRGVIYFIKGDLDKALADFNMSIVSNPDYDDPYNNRGNLYRQRGEPQKAMDDYNAAIRVSKFAPIAYKNRADLYAQTNDIEKAITDYKTALKLDPKFRDAYNNMGFSLRDHGRFQEALNLYQAAIINDPANKAEYHVQRGNVSMDMKDFPKAIDEFRLALQIQPSMPEALFNSGAAFAHLGDLATADTLYSLAIQAMPDAAIIYNNRGEVRRKMGRTAEALTDFLAADRLVPRITMIRQNIIRAYLDSRQTDKAINAFNETISQGVSLDEEFRKEFQKRTEKR